MARPIRVISFWVPGRPAPKGNKKYWNGRPVEQSKGWAAWHDSIWLIAKTDGRSAPKGVPLRVDLCFYFAFPKTAYDRDGGVKSTAELYYRPRPDLDNLCKGVLDSLEDSGTIPHDADVVEVRARKMRDQEPGVQIEIRILEPLTAQNEEMVTHRETVTYANTLRKMRHKVNKLTAWLKKNAGEEGQSWSTRLTSQDETNDY